MLTLNTVPTANGQRASIALEECGLEYSVRKVDLMAGEHRSAEMLALNPVGRMPVLSIRDEAEELDRDLYGSLAIATYAGERTGTLIPKGALSADYHEWIGIIMTDLAPAFSAHFYLSVIATEPQEWGMGWYADIIDRLLNVIDGHLADRQTMVGDEVSLADLMLYPHAATSILRFPQGIEAYPNFQRWAEQTGKREGVRNGMKASS